MQDYLMAAFVPKYLCHIFLHILLVHFNYCTLNIVTSVEGLKGAEFIEWAGLGCLDRLIMLIMVEQINF